MNTIEDKKIAFERVLKIMDELRANCPWDKKQTLESLRHLTLEEVYELSDAILEKNPTELKKELGDVLLHIIFYAKITSESNQFDIADVINSLCEKLIVRHPHIYGNVIANTEEEVKENWEQIKLKEGNKSVLSGVSNGIPSLVKALRMQEKAAQVGFDWDTPEQVWDKINEELAEFKVELNKPNNQLKMEQEFGDLLFSLVNLARKNGINPDNALEYTNKKFRKRFIYIEETANANQKKLTDYTLAEMDAIWNESKLQESK